MSMIIEIQHIPVEGLTLESSQKAASFPVLKKLEASGECRFSDPLSIELTVVSERTLIRVDGSIATTIEQACSRCLAEFKSGLRRRFTLRFARNAAEENGIQDDKEIEVTEEYIGLTYFNGESIDFSDSVQEQVVLALPYKPLCRQDCKGLCARCGADLNAGRCGCAEDGGQSPFAVLQNLSWSERNEK